MNRKKDVILRATVALTENYKKEELFMPKNNRELPSRAAVIDVVKELRSVIFPGYFWNDSAAKVFPEYFAGYRLNDLYDRLKEQIEIALLYAQPELEQEGAAEEADRICAGFFEQLPEVQQRLLKDVQAGFDGDPAAKSKEEIISSYPGLFLMRTEDAIGQVLCHDITQIIPGVKKGPVFQKGHIIAPEDVPVLLSVGKEHVYIWEKDDTRFHENEAARILCEMSRNDYMDASDPSEGKIELTAQVDGLFTLDRQRLYAVNSLGEMMIATRHAGPVKKGDKLAGMRVIPLVIEKEKMAEARETAGNTPLLTLTPYRALKVGLVTTGSEVYYGRIQDQFTPVIKAKLAEYGAEVTHHVLLPDDHAAVTEKIKEFLADGVDMVLCTGGMSVDPDDKTPLAIKNAGVNVVTYGAPVLPGAMFLLSYTDDGRPVCGLPGCVMYAKRTIFDLVLPYLAAGVPVTREQIAAYGEGGLCLNCKVCTWPNCGFGKGV